jgi:hypothetical protein
MNFFIGNSIGDPRYKKAAISGNYNAEMAAGLFKAGNLLKLGFSGLGRLTLLNWLTLLRSIDLFRNAQVAAFGPGNKNSREQAQQSNYNRQYPRTFFQDVRGLLDAHQLVAKTTHISSQTAALGILH